MSKLEFAGTFPTCLSVKFVGGAKSGSLIIGLSL